MNFNPALGFTDILKQAQSEKATVTVHLRGAASLSGRIGAVAEHNVVLTELAGKEFFDALIRIDQITAIETRVRTRWPAESEG